MAISNRLGDRQSRDYLMPKEPLRRAVAETRVQAIIDDTRQRLRLIPRSQWDDVLNAMELKIREMTGAHDDT